MCTAHCPCLDMYFSVSEKLGKGIVLPRMKEAQLVNTVLEVEEVSISKRTHMLG